MLTKTPDEEAPLIHAPPPPNRLTIVQHNIAGWKSKRHQLYNLYSNLAPDIILLNETDHTAKGTYTPPKINFQNYTTYNKTAQGAGTSISIKDNISHKILEDFETELQAIQINTRQGDIVIATDYIPPSRDYIHFPDYYKLLRRQQPVYLVGDLNANHPAINSAQTNTAGRNLTSLIDRNIAKHLGPSFPTRVTGRSSTTPDILISNNRGYHNIHLKAGPHSTSDHTPIVATISANPIMIPINPRKQYHKANWDLYTQELTYHLPTPATQLMTPTEIDQQLDIWNTQVKRASNKYIPTIKHRVLPGIAPSQEIIEQQNIIQLYHMITRTFGPSPILGQLISSAKKHLNQAYITLSDTQWNNIIAKLDIEEDMKQFFSTIKKLKGSDKTSITYIRDHNNIKITDNTEKEQHFRQHWIKIFRNDQEDHLFDQQNMDRVQHHLGNTDTTPLPLSDPSQLSHDFPPFTTQEITKTIAHRKQKAPGPTGITALELKNLPHNMITSLKNIFNHCLATGYFPKQFKHANMIFIPKGTTSQHQVANYRPISLLDTHGKILDKLLNDRLTQHLRQNNLEHPSQHGFRQNRGTHTALAIFHETLSNTHQAQGYHATVTLRDVSKAFDKVWTDGLSYKILQLNLHPLFTKILINYITDRQASIKIQNHIGPPFPLRSGVPQGACLSPTLFNLYTSDITTPETKKLSYTQNIIYADDITQIIYTRGFRTRHHPHDARTAIEHINKFEKTWKIKTNTSKFVTIPLLHKGVPRPIKPNNITLPFSKQGKTLGLTFNTKGYTPHVTKNAAINGNNLQKLKRFNNLSQHNKLRLYKTLILPSLIYPATPLHTIPKAQMSKLQTVQNKALRQVTNADRYTTNEEIHRTCKIDPINVTLHRHANKTWTTIKNTHPEIYKALQDKTPSTPHPKGPKPFPSSRLLAEGPPPDPIFTYRPP